MNALDSSVLVAAIVAAEAFHAECRALVVGEKAGFYGHGISETFNTLTGGRQGFRLGAGVVTKMLEDHFIPRLTMATLTPAEILRSLREAESRGVRGGAVFDYLHLVAARKAKATRFYTLNVAHFRAFHRPGDPEITHP